MAGHTDRRIILLGKSGAGKSATGNTILQRKRFPLTFDTNHLRTEFSLRQSFKKSTNINYKVLDTPGFWEDKGILPDSGYLIQQQITKLCDEPHAFLLVVDPDDCRDTMKLVEVLQTWFGTTMLDHTIVVFTKGNLFKLEESFLSFMQTNGIGGLVDQFGSRIIRMENHGDGRSKSQRELLSVVERTSRNGRAVYRFANIAPLYKFERACRRKSEACGIGEDQCIIMHTSHQRDDIPDNEDVLLHDSSPHTKQEPIAPCSLMVGEHPKERVRDTQNALPEDSGVIQQPSGLGARPKEKATRRESPVRSDVVLAGTISKYQARTSAQNESRDSNGSIRKPLTKKDVQKLFDCAISATDAIRNIGSSPLRSVQTLAFLVDEESLEAIKNVANSEQVQTAVEVTWSFLTRAATAIGDFASSVVDEKRDNESREKGKRSERGDNSIDTTEIKDDV